VTKEEKKSYAKAYYESNKDNKKAYYEANKDNIKSYNKAYYESNKDKRRANYESNKDKKKAYAKAYNKANKDKRKAYYEANKDNMKAYAKAYNKAKRKTDPLFKLKCNLRGRTYLAFKSKGYKKESKTAKTLGASYRIVKKHLERQFTDGMNWENYGDWHVDHIIPLASAKTKDELINLCHFRNLQPLWAEDNFSKGCKIE